VEAENVLAEHLDRKTLKKSKKNRKI
jgi:hypothetical protein